MSWTMWENKLHKTNSKRYYLLHHRNNKNYKNKMLSVESSTASHLLVTKDSFPKH